MGTTDDPLIQHFWDNDLPPTRKIIRYDGTVELTWNVDDCYERYVRVTSSVRGGDHVLVSRDLRQIESAVLSGEMEIFEWVRSRVVGLAKSKERSEGSGEQLSSGG